MDNTTTFPLPITTPLLFHEATLSERLAKVSHILELRSVPIPSSNDDTTVSLSSTLSTGTTADCRGLFAKRDIPAGTLLFNEIPLLYMSGRTQKKLLFESNVYQYQKQTFHKQYKPDGPMSPELPKKTNTIPPVGKTQVSPFSSFSRLSVNPTDIMINFSELEIQLPNLQRCTTATTTTGNETTNGTTKEEWNKLTLLQALHFLQPYPSLPTESDSTLTLSHFTEIIKTNAAEAAFSTFNRVLFQLHQSTVPCTDSTILNNNTLPPDTSKDDDDDPANGISCLLLLFSMFNHSCLPNITWISQWNTVYQAPMFQIYTLQPIKKNDELRISYISEKIYQKERKLDLYNRYKFICNCPRCTPSFDDTRALVCFECCGTVYGNSTRCSSCSTEWYQYIPTDPTRWEPDSLLPLLKLSKRLLDERLRTKQTKNIKDTNVSETGDTSFTSLSLSSSSSSSIPLSLVTSFYNDAVWFLEDEVNLRTLACAAARLHPFDVRFLSILCQIRDEGIDYYLRTLRSSSPPGSNSTSIFSSPVSTSDIALVTVRTLWHISEACLYSITRNVPFGISNDNWHRPQEQWDSLFTNIDVLLLYSLDRMRTFDPTNRTTSDDLPWADFSINSMGQDTLSLWSTVLNRYDRIFQLYTVFKTTIWISPNWSEYLQTCTLFIKNLVTTTTQDPSSDDYKSKEWLQRIQSTVFKNDILVHIQEGRIQRKKLREEDTVFYEYSEAGLINKKDPSGLTSSFISNF